MLKILQARLQQYVNCELPNVQAGFRKSRGTIDQISNILWIIEKTREFQKSICFCFLTCIQISQETGNMVLHSYLFKNFPVFYNPHSQRLWIVSEAEVGLFGIPSFLYDPVNVGNLIFY